MKIGSLEFWKVTYVGGRENPLLIRWTLFRFPAFGIYLHKFCRSDYDRALHDHPWPFISIILRGGYAEQHTQTQDGQEIVEWRRPGSILLRPASWRHRVILEEGKTSWNLILVGRRCQKWGFFINGKWCWWRHHNPASNICEDYIVHWDGKD